MRYLILITVVSIFVCACSDDSARQEYQEFVDPGVVDSIPTLEKSGPLTLSVSYELPQMPKVSCDQLTVIMKFHIHGDSIKSYDIHTSCYEAKSEKEDEKIIQKGDSKTKIAKRLGISPDRILNKEPLRVGEKIKLQ
jgi:hypothetical protein